MATDRPPRAPTARASRRRTDPVRYSLITSLSAMPVRYRADDPPGGRIPAPPSVAARFTSTRLSPAARVAPTADARPTDRDVPGPPPGPIGAARRYAPTTRARGRTPTTPIWRRGPRMDAQLRALGPRRRALYLYGWAYGLAGFWPEETRSPAAIRDAARRRMALEPGDAAEAAAIREGVEDALAGLAAATD